MCSVRVVFQLVIVEAGGMWTQLTKEPVSKKTRMATAANEREALQETTCDPVWNMPDGEGGLHPIDHKFGGSNTVGWGSMDLSLTPFVKIFLFAGQMSSESLTFVCPLSHSQNGEICDE